MRVCDHALYLAHCSRTHGHDETKHQRIDSCGLTANSVCDSRRGGKRLADVRIFRQRTVTGEKTDAHHQLKQVGSAMGSGLKA
jgi:hypothetical protein